MRLGNILLKSTAKLQIVFLVIISFMSYMIIKDPFKNKIIVIQMLPFITSIMALVYPTFVAKDARNRELLDNLIAFRNLAVVANIYLQQRKGNGFNNHSKEVEKQYEVCKYSLDQIDFRKIYPAEFIQPLADSWEAMVLVQSIKYDNDKELGCGWADRMNNNIASLEAYLLSKGAYYPQYERAGEVTPHTRFMNNSEGLWETLFHSKRVT